MLFDLFLLYTLFLLYALLLLSRSRPHAPLPSMAKLTNTSLGSLGRLPPELRNRIYKLAIDTTNDRLEIFSPCHGPRRQLALVSKQIHNETINIIEALAHKPCAHWNFYVRMQAVDARTASARPLAPWVFFPSEIVKHRLLKPGATFHLSTAHLNISMPHAVDVTLRDTLTWPTNEIQLNIEIFRAASQGVAERGPCTMSVHVPFIHSTPLASFQINVRERMARLAYAAFHHVHYED